MLSSFRFGIFVVLLNASIDRGLSQDYPEWNQQCQDDAGPPFLDDSETFGEGVSYHSTSSAEAVLVNGECAGPVADACESRGDPLTAYLEGPTSCTNGWFCRILVDENWEPQNLIGDLNFGYCNSTESASSDQSGHCHGGSEDSTFYWWVRDHWYRGYNGRLRCCCGWDTLATSNIVNRCDYRKEVTQDENVEDCRDANEEHNSGYEGGCTDVGAEIEEDDGECWEVLRFGNVDGSGGGGGIFGSGSGSGDNVGSGSGSGSGDNEGSEDWGCDYDYNSESENEGGDGDDEEEDEEEKGGIFRALSLKLLLINKLHR